jgi:hypothetical protein
MLVFCCVPVPTVTDSWDHAEVGKKLSSMTTMKYLAKREEMDFNIKETLDNSKFREYKG